jgi:hypothetical protein
MWMVVIFIVIVIRRSISSQGRLRLPRLVVYFRVVINEKVVAWPRRSECLLGWRG